MILLGSTENKITKDKNFEIVPHFEITEVVIIFFIMITNKIHESYIHLLQINYLVVCQKFLQKTKSF